MNNPDCPNCVEWAKAYGKASGQINESVARNTDLWQRIIALRAVAEAAKSAWFEKGGPATVLEERLMQALRDAGYLHEPPPKQEPRIEGERELFEGDGDHD